MAVIKLATEKIIVQQPPMGFMNSVVKQMHGPNGVRRAITAITMDVLIAYLLRLLTSDPKVETPRPANETEPSYAL